VGDCSSEATPPGKSRLSGVLSLEARTALNHYLLSNTLETLASVPEIEHSLVVSRDPEALTIAVSMVHAQFKNKALLN